MNQCFFEIDWKNNENLVNTIFQTYKIHFLQMLPNMLLILNKGNEKLENFDEFRVSCSFFNRHFRGSYILTAIISKRKNKICFCICENIEEPNGKWYEIFDDNALIIDNIQAYIAENNILVFLYVWNVSL